MWEKKIIMITFQPVLDHDISSLNLTINSWCHLNPYQLFPHASVQGGSGFELAGLTPFRTLATAGCSSGSSPGWSPDWPGEPSPAPWTPCHGGRWTKSHCHLRDTSATSAHKRQALSQGRHTFCHMRSLREASLASGGHMWAESDLKAHSPLFFVRCQCCKNKSLINPKLFFSRNFFKTSLACCWCKAASSQSSIVT